MRLGTCNMRPCSIREINPPSPPFNKGGLGRISEIPLVISHSAVFNSYRHDRAPYTLLLPPSPDSESRLIHVPRIVELATRIHDEKAAHFLDVVLPNRFTSDPLGSGRRQPAVRSFREVETGSGLSRQPEQEIQGSPPRS